MQTLQLMLFWLNKTAMHVLSRKSTNIQVVPPIA